MDGMSNSAYRYIETQRISGALGAEVSGVSLAEPLAPEVLAEIRSALLENQVIFFRDQDMNPERLLRFAHHWGEIHRHPYIAGMPDYPDVLELSKKPGDKRNFGGDWHTDQMFAPRPALGTILWAKQTPEAGGDTLFANMYLAYETLSDGMKKLISDIRGMCVGDKKKGGGDARRGECGDDFDDHAGASARDAGLGASVGSHASRNGAQVAVYRRPRALPGEHDGRRERSSDQLSIRALDQARVHLQVPLATRIAGVLG